MWKNLAGDPDRPGRRRPTLPYKAGASADLAIVSLVYLPSFWSGEAAETFTDVVRKKYPKAHHGQIVCKELYGRLEIVKKHKCVFQK